MSTFTLKLTAAHSKQAKDLVMKVLGGGKLTNAEWEILYNEGVRKRPAKKQKR